NPCATSTRGGTSSDTKAEEKHHVGSGAGAVAVPGGRARGLSSAGFPVGCATPVPLVRSLRFQPPPHRVKSTAGEVPLAGSFSVGLFPNRACKFPRTLLSSDHFGYGLVARPAWMSSWQRRQVTRVLRRRMAMRCIHAGFSRRTARAGSGTGR